MFDSVLDQHRLPKRRFGAGAAVSVLLHLGLLGALLWFTSHPGAQVVRQVAVVFRSALPAPVPPPPPLGLTGTQKSKPVEQKPRRLLAVRPREAEPSEPSPERPAPRPEGAPAGVTGGVPEGQLGGVIGGVTQGVPGGQPGGSVGSEVVPFGEGMTRPVRIEGMDPVYTRQALEARIEGTMLVRCVITTEGHPENCRVIKPLPHMEQAVLAALSGQRYKPASFQGKPLAVDYLFTIRLVLPH